MLITLTLVTLILEFGTGLVYACAIHLLVGNVKIYMHPEKINGRLFNAYGDVMMKNSCNYVCIKYQYYKVTTV